MSSNAVELNLHKRNGKAHGKAATLDAATIAEIVEVTGWRAHTARGFLAGALKKRLGLDVTSEKEGERGRVYRIAGRQD